MMIVDDADDDDACMYAFVDFCDDDDDAYALTVEILDL